jgi:hypothetical protein
MMTLLSRSISRRAPSAVLTRYLHCSAIRCSGKENADERAFEGVSEATSRMIYEYAHHPQTSVSLKTLMQSGRGEFLNKTYKEELLPKGSDNKVATEKVLMQVSRQSVHVHKAK